MLGVVEEHGVQTSHSIDHSIGETVGMSKHEHCYVHTACTLISACHHYLVRGVASLPGEGCGTVGLFPELKEDRTAPDDH